MNFVRFGGSYRALSLSLVSTHTVGPDRQAAQLSQLLQLTVIQGTRLLDWRGAVTIRFFTPSSFLVLNSVYLLVVRVEGCYCPLSCSGTHTTLTKDKHPSPAGFEQAIAASDRP